MCYNVIGASVLYVLNVIGASPVYYGLMISIQMITSILSYLPAANWLISMAERYL